MSFEKLPSPRIVNLGGFLVCSGLMGFALYAQYVLLLNPCPLCSLQRVAVITIGILFLLATLQNPAGWGRRVYAGLLAIAALGGAGVAAWHVRMQNLPPDQVPSCGPGLDYMIDTLPLTEVLSKIFSGSGECADVVWQFLGLSMPGWVFVWMVALGGAGVWNNLRRA